MAGFRTIRIGDMMSQFGFSTLFFKRNKPSHNNRNTRHRDDVNQWVGEKSAETFGYLKEGFFHMKHDIGERLHDLKDEYNQVYHPKPRVVRVHIIKEEPKEEEICYEACDKEQDTPSFCGMEWPLLCCLS